MKSTINLKYICIKPRPQCHFLFASFVLSFIFFLTVSVFLSFRFKNLLVKQNQDSCIIKYCFLFITFIFNVKSNCSASSSTINVPLKKINGCYQKKQRRFISIDNCWVRSRKIFAIFDINSIQKLLLYGECLFNKKYEDNNKYILKLLL